ncbi:MAG: hypothetical protein ACREYC_23875, partial [Gammaproteobacteria bacterium]
MSDINHLRPQYPPNRLSRAKKRQALLEATERELNEIVAATTRALRPLKGEAPIGLRVGKV